MTSSRYIPYNPQADSSYWIAQGLQQMLSGLGPGLARQQSNRLLDQDFQRLQAYSQSQLPVGQVGPQMSFPNFQSPQMQQMAAQGMMGNMFMSPLDKLKMMETARGLQKPFYQPGVIENTETAEQRPYTYGESIPPGWKIVREAQTVVNVGTPPASPTERKEIAETRASIDALNNLKELYDSSQTKTGPIAGRISPIAGLVGMTTDEQEAFMAATSAFKNAIIKEITGAQMSEVEAARIMKQVPDITDPSTRWNAKWEQSKKNLEFLQKRRSEVLRQSGLKPPEPPEAKPTDLTNQIIPDSVIDNMSLEEVEAALAQIEENITLKPGLEKPKTSIEKGMVQQQNEMAKRAKSEMSRIIGILPDSTKRLADKLTPNHRSRLYIKMNNFGYENWKTLTDKQKLNTILRMINETRK
jgi:hypothetical protein